MKIFHCVFVATWFVITQVPAMAATSVQKMERMVNLLDKLDREDLLDGIEKANNCTTERKFACADKELTEVKKLINGGEDKKLWEMAMSYRLAEQRRMDEEARQRQMAEERIERMQRQAEAEEERRIAAIAAQEKREQDARESAANTQGALAILGAIAIGKATSGRNYTDTQRRELVEAYVSDRKNAIDGTVSNNFAQRANTVKRELDENSEAAARAQRRESDQARQAMAKRRADMDRQSTMVAQSRASPEPGQRAKATEPELPKYQPQVVTIPTGRQNCPPGSSPMRHANGVALTIPAGAACVKDAQSSAEQVIAQGSTTSAVRGASSVPSSTAAGANSSSGSARSDPSESTKREVKAPKKVEWGPIQLESFAICRQSQKSKKWECNGALDNQIIADEPTLESALGRQHCEGGTWAAGGPTLNGVQWEAYRCNRSLGAGDYDVIKRYGMISARRSYMCPKYQPSDGRCTVVYDGQDKR
jgi:hypothetical protein